MNKKHFYLKLCCKFDLKDKEDAYIVSVPLGKTVGWFHRTRKSFTAQSISALKSALTLASDFFSPPVANSCLQ